MTSIRIAIAAAFTLGALFAGSTQVQHHAAPAHAVALMANPNELEPCC
jgi:hypothetical protein